MSCSDPRLREAADGLAHLDGEPKAPLRAKATMNLRLNRSSLRGRIQRRHRAKNGTTERRAEQCFQASTRHRTPPPRLAPAMYSRATLSGRVGPPWRRPSSITGATCGGLALPEGTPRRCGDRAAIGRHTALCRAPGSGARVSPNHHEALMRLLASHLPAERETYCTQGFQFDRIALASGTLFVGDPPLMRRQESRELERGEENRSERIRLRPPDLVCQGTGRRLPPASPSPRRSCPAAPRTALLA